jgi:hypothetical protein
MRHRYVIKHIWRGEDSEQVHNSRLHVLATSVNTSHLSGHLATMIRKKYKMIAGTIHAGKGTSGGFVIKSVSRSKKKAEGPLKSNIYRSDLGVAVGLTQSI